MIVLNHDQLRNALEDLPSYLPKSLQIQAVIRNHLSKNCDWPGTEIAVDEFPNYSFIYLRPVKGSKDYIPWPRSDCYIIFCKDVEKCRHVIDDEEFVDWSRALLFFGVSRHDAYPLLLQRAQEKAKVHENLTGLPDLGNVWRLPVETLHQRNLPKGFRLGELSIEHAEQCNNEWRYGSTASLPFFQHIIGARFPNSAVFTEDDNRLVAYIVYQPDGCMGHGFVNPEFRNRNLYQVVNYDLAKKVVAMGQPVPWVYVMKWNEVSQNAYRKLGAQMIDENVYAVDWIICEPRTKEDTS